MKVHELQARTAIHGGRLRVVAAVTTSSPLSRGVVLRVGRRTRTLSARPTVAQTAFETRVAVPRGRRTLRVAVTRRESRRAIGELVLPRQAWGPLNQDKPFGASVAVLPDLAVLAFRYDAVGISDDAVRPTERWTVVASGAADVLSACPLLPTSCAPAPRPVPLVVNRPRTVQRRPLIRTGDPTVGAAATVNSATLFSVELPRPVR